MYAVILRCQIAVLLGALTPLVASAADPLIGQQVFWKHGAKAKVDDKEIDIEKVGFPATVEDVNGEWLWVGRAWVRRSDVMETPQALEYFTERIRKNPKKAMDWGNRGAVWYSKGEHDIAVKDYSEAIRLRPESPVWYNDRGNSWRAKGDYVKALQDYTEAIRAEPKFALAYYNRGRLWQHEGEHEAAIGDFTEALRLDSNDSRSFVARGASWIAEGAYGKAIEDFAAAMRIDPKFAQAFNNFARIRATCPEAEYRNGAEAVHNATTACELTLWKNATSLETLAAASAEAGDFPSAIKWQEKGIELTANESEKKLLRERLELYKAGAPFHEAPKNRVAESNERREQ